MWAGIFSLCCAALVTVGAHTIVNKRLRDLPVELRQRYGIPLHDEVHYWFPDLQKYRWIPDTICQIFQLCAVIIIPTQMNILMVMMGILYTVRAISFCSTILPTARVFPLETEEKKVDEFQKKLGDTPDASPTARRTCKNKIKSIVSRLMQVEKITRVGFKHDLLFSGHCCVVVTICVHWSMWIPCWIGYQYAYWLIALAMTVFIIISRCHYTICCLYAWICCYAAYTTIVPFLVEAGLAV